MKKILLFVGWTLINVVVFQLCFCMPLNVNSFAFWLELMLEVGLFFCLFTNVIEVFELTLFSPVVIVIAASLLWGSLYSAPFSLKDYQNSAEIKEPISVELDVDQVQLVDKASAEKLGDRIFGTIGQELVSQFSVGEYTQIVYNDRLVRVAPIEFGGFFSYLNNKVTPGYIVVDVKTGESQVVETEMRFLKSACFGENLYRKIWFYNMSYRYGKSSFELDEDGNPYYIVPVIKDHFGKLSDVKAVLTVNVKNGEINEYKVDEAPEWVDNVYPVNVSYDKYNRSMKYANGCFNLSKKGVVQLTEDYSYLKIDGTLYFYSGVTSVSNDESNVGYVYVNCHTGEFHYTSSFGAEEFSAKASAEGVLQEKGYTSVFPTLVTLNGEEVYFMALKDNAGLIKAYALVSYKNYQKAFVGETVEEVIRKFSGNSGKTEDSSELIVVVEITIKNINQVVINGNTIVVIEDSEGNVHSYDMSRGDLRMALLQIGEKISFAEYETRDIVNLE